MTRSNGGGEPDTWVVLPAPELMATVVLAPAPQIPLASLRDLLTPVHDETGRLCDWQLFGAGFDRPDAIPEYLAWRSAWRRQFPIGPLSNVVTLASEAADIEHDLDRSFDELLTRLIRAGGEDVVVPLADAPALLDEIEMVRLALSVDPRLGSGIVDDMPALTRGEGLSRTWAPGDREVVLAATSSTVVVVRPNDGLTVLHGGPEHRAFPGITGADLRNEVVVIGNDRGASLRLPLHEARPLGWLVPRSLRWHVVPVPLAVVWASLFTGLTDALHASVSHGEPVVITSDIGVAGREWW
jgi:hypothetical protein